MSSPSAAFIGYGASLSYSTTSGGTFTPIAELSEMVPPKTVVKDAEVTRYDSPGETEEFVTGYRNGGEPTFKANFLKAQYAILYGMIGTPFYWKFQFNDGTVPTTGSVIECYGWINEMGAEVPMKEKVSCTLKMRISGLPTFTAGT